MKERHSDNASQRRAVKGGLACTAQRYFPSHVINYCYECLMGNKVECQHGLERCEEKSAWNKFRSAFPR